MKSLHSQQEVKVQEIVRAARRARSVEMARLLGVAGQGLKSLISAVFSHRPVGKDVRHA